MNGGEENVCIAFVGKPELRDHWDAVSMTWEMTTNLSVKNKIKRAEPD